MTNRDRLIECLNQMSDKELAEFIEYDMYINSNCEFCVWEPSEASCYGDCVYGVDLYLKKDVKDSEE